MKPECRFYEISPKIVPADRETTVEIRPLFDHLRFQEDAEYGLTFCPTEEFAQRSGWTAPERVAVTPVDGRLRITRYFEGEQEHVLYVDRASGSERKPVGDFRVYSLESDLFARRPYKGDVHMHSNQSDGKESPGFVAGSCRGIGMDFMALTDHRKYSPSLEAQRAFAGVQLDMRIYPGEEVHPPENPVHIINFGGDFSVNERFQDEAAYRAEVRAIENGLGELPPGVNRYQYASCVWCFDRIREGGGLGVFCHPYWFTQHRYTPSGALTSYLFEQAPFDAYEIIGGFHRYEADSNTLQVARYHEERARGRRIPIVGVSDAHGCNTDDLFSWYYTIVFAHSLELGDLIAGIKDLYSVAVEAMTGEIPRAYGPFRLVKYALFLLREVFPLHDALCVEEGRLMLAHLDGNPPADTLLAALSGRTAALYDRLWARV